MTELPTSKQGHGRPAERPPRRRALRPSGVDLRGGTTSHCWCGRHRPPISSTASAGWPSSSCPGKPALGRPRGRAVPAARCQPCLRRRVPLDRRATPRADRGRDRFVADLRPLVPATPLACHPYDVCTAMLLEEVGGVVTDPWGKPLDVAVGHRDARWPGSATPTRRWRHGSDRCWPSWWTSLRAG